MGLLMRLPKEDNALYYDFENAYWCIEDARFGTSNGEPVTSFEWLAYASREAKLKNMSELSRTIPYGGPTGTAYLTALHRYKAVYPTREIFPNGIPIEEKDQKNVLYSFIKERLGLTDYIDVFE